MPGEQPTQTTGEGAERQGSSSPASPGPAPSNRPLHSVEHWEQQLAAPAGDDDNDDADSALGSNPASSTASITSTILQYRTINGRTFHSEIGDTNYWASNDEQQNEALDLVHHFLTLVLDDKLHLAPIDSNIKLALDIGTGTGIWAIDFADQYPSVEVIGTDISPIQPSWIPPNLKFEIEDCSREWTFKPDSVDYIHIRYLHGSIKDWPSIFTEAFKACAPNGWVESMEASAMMVSDDDTVADDSAMHEWGRLFQEGGKKMGQSFEVVEDGIQKKYMEEAGFVDIHVENRRVPIGAWPKDARMKQIGQYVHAALEQDLEGFVLYMANQLMGWTMQEVSVYCAQLRRELRSKKHHAYFWVRVVYGRKPAA
ncbi:hypothetical protein ACJZ2D_016134 [Fusarium nematophilum]